MENKGMVAVVRGTKDAGICVTLLDGTRQYTLLPNTCQESQPVNTRTQSSQYANAVDSSAQAIDGRYASIYQTVHCNMVPTSPAVDVSEFPPQRAALSKGHGNFEIGGLGSGEKTFQPSKANDTYRGGLNWPERGIYLRSMAEIHNWSVFSPRHSVDHSLFANSLRKYPSLSPERSSEMVERLINYAQFRNSKIQKIPAQRSESSNRPRKTFEGDIRTDESPTRERSRRCYEDCTTERYDRLRKYEDDRSRRYDEGDRRYDKNYDVRHYRDGQRRGKELFRNIPYVRPACPTIKERFIDQLPEVQISIDTQVDIPRTSSKSVSTVPRPNPTMRNVAISMSPMPSKFALPTYTKTSISIQTLRAQEISLLPRKSVQTCFSSIEVTNKKIINLRKSKSQEDLRANLDDEVPQLVHDLGSEEKTSFRDELLKKLKNIYKTDLSDRIKIKFDPCVKDKLFSENDLKEFTKELSYRLLSEMKKSCGIFYNPIKLYGAEIQSMPHRDNGVNCVDDVIEEWLRLIPIKNRDHLGKSIEKDNLLLTIAKKIKRTVVSNFELESDKSLKTEIIKVIEDVPIATGGCDKKLYVNRLATNLIRRIKEAMIMFTRKVEKSNVNNKNNINEMKSVNSRTKEEAIKYYVREELIDFLKKFHLSLCPASMRELEAELIDIVLDTIRSGKEDKIKDDILSKLFYLLRITECQANYFANNMILNMKKNLSDVYKIKSLTFIELFKQRAHNTDSLIDGVTGNDIKANLVWYTNQIIQQINEWVSGIRGLDPNENFTQLVIHDLAGDIVDRHKYLQQSPTTNAVEIDDIEHLKYHIFKWINKLVGDDNLETLDKAPELMAKIRNIPVPKLIKSHKINQEYCQIDYDNEPCSDSTRTSITVDYNQGIARSNITVAIGSVTQNKTFVTLPMVKSEPGSSKDRPPHGSNNNMSAEQKTQYQIIEEFDEFLKDWVQRIPISEKPEHIAKCRQGIYNGVWKTITKIKMNPETIHNPFYYKDVLHDEIEELLNCLTQTPELNKKRNDLKTEIIEKAAEINALVDPDAFNTSYRQQLVENISDNLPQTVNRVDHTGQDLNKLYDEVMKLHLAEYFILYTKYKEDDAIKANAFKRKLLQEVHKLVEGVKRTHGKELREIEIKQYIEGVIHALQNVPVPNDETVNIESDEIILALEVEQWFSDLPLMPNDERMDALSRRKYRDVLAKTLFDLENSNGSGNDGQMREEIIKFLKRMPLRPGAAEDINFMVEELMVRIKNRPREGANNRALAFVDPHGYEAFSRDMPLCSSYTDDQGSSYMIEGGERVADRSMAYGGQYVQRRNEPDSQQEWLFSEQGAAQGTIRGDVPSGGQPIEVERSANRSMPCGGQCVQRTNDLGSQQEWLPLDQTVQTGAMRGVISSGRQPIEAERSANRSMPCGGQCVQRTNDPGSQQEWLSLDQTVQTGAMRGDVSSGGQSLETERSANKSMPCGSQCAQGTNDQGARKKSIVSVEPHGYDTFSRDMPLSSSYTDDQGSSYMIEGGERVADRSMAYGGQYVQRRNDPNQREWPFSEKSAAQGTMRSDVSGGRQPTEAERSANRSMPCGGQCVQKTNDPGSQQEWLSLDQTVQTGAMRGDVSSGGQSMEADRSANRSIPSGGQYAQGTNDPNSQQEWLSLDQSVSPGTIFGDISSGGQPIETERSANRSMSSGGQFVQGTNDPGARKKSITFVEPHGYDTFSRDMPLSSSYTDDQGSSYMIEGGERVADRSMAYGGQYVQRRNDPDSQQEWPFSEKSAAQGTMRSDVSGGRQPTEAERSANRSMPCGSQCVQKTNDPGSQQEWLSLDQTVQTGAMRGDVSSGGQSMEADRSANRPIPSEGQYAQGTNDPSSQREWLSLDQTISPGSTIGDISSGGQPIETERSANKSMPCGSQCAQGTNDHGARKKSIVSVEPHGYETFSRDIPLSSSYTDDQGSSYMIEGGERVADRSMAYGGQYVQRRNDPDSQQEWPFSEKSAAQRTMRSDVSGGRQPTVAERSANRSMPCGSQCVQKTNDPGSQQEWLSLDQTVQTGAMRGDVSSGGQSMEADRSANRSIPSEGQYAQGTNDPSSQREWLSLDQTVSPGSTIRDISSGGQPIETERSANKSMPCGSQCAQGTNDQGARKKSIVSVEPHGYETFSRDMPLSSSYTDDQGSSYMIEGGERVADRSMAYGGQHVQHRNDPDSQQEWLFSEQSAAQETMRGDVSGGRQPIEAERSANRSMPCGGQCVQRTNDPGSRQEWLSLDQTVQTGAMRGDVSSGRQSIEAERSANRSIPSEGQYAQETNDPSSQREWLSLDQTVSPRTTIGDISSGGQPIETERSTNKSMPCGSQCAQGTNDQGARNKSISAIAPDSQQQWLSLEQTVQTEDRSMRGDVSSDGQEAGRSSNRSTSNGGQYVQKTNDPGSQQEWRSFNQTLSPEAMGGSLRGPSQNISKRESTSSPVPRQGTDPCCKDPNGLQSTSSPRRYSSPGRVSTQSACCGRPNGLQSASSTRGYSSLGVPQSASSPQGYSSLGTPQGVRSPRGYSSLGVPQGASSTRGYSSLGAPQGARSHRGYSSLGVPQGAGSSRGYSSLGAPQRTGSPRGHSSLGTPQSTGSPRGYSSLGAPQRAGSPRGYSSLGLPQRAGSPQDYSSLGAPQSTGPCCGRPSCLQGTTLSPQEASQLPPSALSTQRKLLSPSHVRHSISFAPQASTSSCCKRASCPSQISTSSQTHPVQIQGTSETRTGASPSNMPSTRPTFGVSSEQTETAVSQGQIPARSQSGEGPVTTKTKPQKKKRHPKVECQCYITPHDLNSENAGTISRGQSPDNFVTQETEPPTGSPRLCTRPCRPPYGEGYSVRPVGHSSKQGTVGPSGRNKRKSRDTGQRETSTEDSDESDEVDLKCRCLERVWKWGRRRKCKPCDDHPDMEFMCPPFHMMYPPPSCYYY